MSVYTLEPVKTKVVYRRKSDIYRMVWDFEIDRDESGESYLLDYSKNTSQKLLYSGKRRCEQGIFEGPGKYFEFFAAVVWPRPHYGEPQGLEVLVKISYPGSPLETIKSFGEIYVTDNTAHVERVPVGVKNKTRIDLFEACSTPESIPEEYKTESEENTKVIWLNGTTFDRTNNITRLTFVIPLRRDAWAENEHLESYFVNSGTLQNSLNTSHLLCSSTFSDVKIMCGGKEFPAHKLILSGRSSVLQTMFSQKMLESTSGILEIRNAEPEIVEEFLRFIYTGSVADMAKNSQGLYLLADKYDVQDLRIACEKHLLRSISDETVLQIYNLGKLLCSNALIDVCVQKIKRDKQLIWKTESELSEAFVVHPELVFKILL